jgi:heme-degrading monooxygenase HmoA
MYVRAVWFEGAPDELEARVARYPQQMQPMRAAPGCLGIAALADRETGAGISVTYWDSQQSMLATEPQSETIRAQAVADSRLRVVDIDRFEMILVDRAAPPAAGSFARMTDVTVPAANVDAAAEVLRSHLPEGRKLPGFRALLVGANRETGRTVTTTTWNTAADREASAEPARAIGDEMSNLRGDATPKVSLYEVVYSDVSVPTTV